MKKKQFKAESQKLLDLMINSIYTNKEIFLRELISNASDAIDKVYYQSLTDDSIDINKDDLAIEIKYDKENRTLTISDTGCGMTEEELEKNLGTIAESGSNLFKQQNDSKEISIIGQFGVGFYSAFMVASKVEVLSKPLGSEESYLWTSTGQDGYSIEKAEKENYGTDIILTIKEDSEEYDYCEFLEAERLKEIVQKYSNYIRYPIKMEVLEQKLKKGSKDEYEEIRTIETLNSMKPLWKKSKSDVTEEEYNNFYTASFSDYEEPLHMVRYDTEGICSFNSLLFIPKHAPYDLYTKEYKRGLQLYAKGVLIMDTCEQLLPDYYGFVKGLVDSDDLSLNISREMLQQDRQLVTISKNIEKKITKELESLLKNEREKYEEFFKVFGLQLKMGIYNTYGMKKDDLQDLLLFVSSNTKKYITLNEYVENMKENQEHIYYATGESVDKIDLLPQVEAMKEKGYEILYLTESVDEFVLQIMMLYEKKNFMNVANTELSLETEEEKKELEKLSKEHKNVLTSLKEGLKDKVTDVKFTMTLKKHPVCLTTEGVISSSMEKVLNNIPNSEKVKASEVLMINANHPIAQKLQSLNKEELEKYAKILYSQARLIEGLTLENPSEISDLICEVLSK